MGLAGNLPSELASDPTPALSVRGELFAVKCLMGGALLQDCCKWWDARGSYEPLCTTGSGPWGSLLSKHLGTRMQTPLLPARCLQNTLPTKLATVPAGKEAITKGLRSIFMEKAKRMDLEPRGKQLITSIREGEIPSGRYAKFKGRKS